VRPIRYERIVFVLDMAASGDDHHFCKYRVIKAKFTSHRLLKMFVRLRIISASWMESGRRSDPTRLTMAMMSIDGCGRCSRRIIRLFYVSQNLFTPRVHSAAEPCSRAKRPRSLVATCRLYTENLRPLENPPRSVRALRKRLSVCSCRRSTEIGIENATCLDPGSRESQFIDLRRNSSRSTRQS
jgi:hypothetical protein